MHLTNVVWLIIPESTIYLSFCLNDQFDKMGNVNVELDA